MFVANQKVLKTKERQQLGRGLDLQTVLLCPVWVLQEAFWSIGSQVEEGHFSLYLF